MSGGLWWFFDEAFWIGLEGAVEGSLTGRVDLAGLTVGDLVRRHLADASMAMILIIPIEEAAAEPIATSM